MNIQKNFKNEKRKDQVEVVKGIKAEGKEKEVKIDRVVIRVIVIEIDN